MLHAAENLGEVLYGSVIENAPFVLRFGKTDLKVLCRVEMGAEERKVWTQRIREEYRGHLLLDNLPVATRLSNAASSASRPAGRSTGVHYERGYRVGFIGGNAAESTYVLLRVRERAPDEAAGADRGGEIMEILPVEDQYSFRPKITYKTLTLEEAEEQERKLRTGEERFDRINRKKAAAAPEDGEEAAAAAAAELDFDVWGARTADLGGKAGEDMEPEEGATASTSRRTTTASTTTTTTPARRTTTGRAGRAARRSGAAVGARRGRPARDGNGGGGGRRRRRYVRACLDEVKNDEGSLWTHFKAKRRRPLEEAKKDELKAKREQKNSEATTRTTTTTTRASSATRARRCCTR